MKTRTRELAKPGIYGTVDNPTIVTERDLIEISETFPDIKKAPISMNGHWPDPAKPRLGNVIGVTWDATSKRLTGEVEEQDTLSKAVDDGFFPDCSIGAKRRASDGKMYLHHLAYLGEEPPAIKDLVTQIARDLGADGIAASDKASVFNLPPASAPFLMLTDPTATAGDAGVIQDKKEGDMRTLEQAEAELASEKERATALSAEMEKLKATLSRLAEKYPDEGIALADSDPRVSALVKQVRDGKRGELLKAAAGKVPKGKESLLLALSDSLAPSSRIELADGSGGKREVSQFDLVIGILDSIPSAISGGRLDLADPADNDKPLDMKKLQGRF